MTAQRIARQPVTDQTIKTVVAQAHVGCARRHIDARRRAQAKHRAIPARERLPTAPASARRSLARLRSDGRSSTPPTTLRGPSLPKAPEQRVRPLCSNSTTNRAASTLLRRLQSQPLHSCNKSTTEAIFRKGAVALTRTIERSSAMKTDTILVTGGAGFIGSNFVMIERLGDLA